MNMVVAGAVLHVAAPVGQAVLVALLTSQSGPSAARKAATFPAVPAPLHALFRSTAAFLRAVLGGVRLALQASATNERRADEDLPVFADPSGRRRRRFQLIAAGFGAACAANLVVLGVTFTGGPIGPPGHADPRPAGIQPVAAGEPGDRPILVPGAPAVEPATAPAPAVRPRRTRPQIAVPAPAPAAVEPPAPVAKPVPAATKSPADPPAQPPADPRAQPLADPAPTPSPADEPTGEDPATDPPAGPPGPPGPTEPPGLV